jgi:hypothetical protein
MLHDLPTSPSSIVISLIIFSEEYKYEAPHYAVFFPYVGDHRQTKLWCCKWMETLPYINFKQKSVSFSPHTLLFLTMVIWLRIGTCGRLLSS